MPARKKSLTRWIRRASPSWMTKHRIIWGMRVRQGQGEQRRIPAFVDLYAYSTLAFGEFQDGVRKERVKPNTPAAYSTTNDMKIFGGDLGKTHLHYAGGAHSHRPEPLHGRTAVDNKKTASATKRVGRIRNGQSPQRLRKIGTRTAPEIECVRRPAPK